MDTNTGPEVGSNDELGLDTERAAFEAWCRQRWAVDLGNLRRRDAYPESERYGQYVLANVEVSWQAWQGAAAAKQAQIDRLMLEHCPDEMTAEQRAEWARHQAPRKTACPHTDQCHPGHCPCMESKA